MNASCERTRGLLDDFVDGTLAEAERRSVEEHLAECGECRREEAQLRALLAEAKALALEVPPPWDLWPRIERRIRPAGHGAWLRYLAAAACLVLAVAVALTARAPRTSAPTVAGSRGAAASALPAALDNTDVAQVERDYEQAAAALLARLRSRQAELPPETVAQVEESLRTIDAALAQIRTALRDRPQEPALHLMLAATHRKKVEVLQRVVDIGV